MELIKNVKELKEFLKNIPDDYEIRVADNEYMCVTPARIWISNNTILFDTEV